MKEFKVGDKVYGMRWGEGVVIKTKGFGNYPIVVDFGRGDIQAFDYCGIFDRCYIPHERYNIKHLEEDEEKKEEKQQIKFKVGDKVVSKRYGQGTVARVYDNGRFEVDLDGNDSYSPSYHANGRYYRESVSQFDVKHLEEEKTQPKFREGDTVYWPGMGFCTLRGKSDPKWDVKDYYSFDVIQDNACVTEVSLTGHANSSDKYPAILTLAEASLLGIRPEKKKIKKTLYFVVELDSRNGSPSTRCYENEDNRNCHADLSSKGGSLLETFERTVEVEVDE